MGCQGGSMDLAFQYLEKHDVGWQHWVMGDPEGVGHVSYILFYMIRCVLILYNYFT